MESIAIVGLSTLFPGSKTPEEFWQNLKQKNDCRSIVTREKMRAEPSEYFGKKGDTDKFYCMQGGFIKDFHFDSNGYRLDGHYLNQLDDLYQWVLHVAKVALEDAGYWQSEKLASCGAILGNLSFPTKTSNELFLPLYHHVLKEEIQKITGQPFEIKNFSEKQSTHEDNGLIAGFPTALMAKATGLGGSFFALDAACASSCYALKLACDYLHTGKADMMLAGAVSAADPTFVNMGFSIFQAYPANNVSAPLDTRSQGLFAGEGAGMMVLKRHSDAVRDGDHIHAVIRGGALSNDGKGEFVLSPNSKGQVLVYERAYADANASPTEIDFVECHATGTPKGDKVELSSMEKFFSRYNNKPLIGSAKSNLGHLLTAAGMPGMTKTIMSLNSGEIPATINIEQPQQSTTGYFSKDNIPTETTPWPVQRELRKAGVSVFGFGGSNAHIVLEQANTEVKNNGKNLNNKEPLAIVGMDGHFAGCSTIREMADSITNNRSSLSAVPKDRWMGMQKNTTLMDLLDHPENKKGGFVENFDIDFLRFKVPPNEKDALIPQQLMMMKVADNAAQDAGLSEGGNVAVLVAMGVELELHQYRGRVNLLTQVRDSLKEQGITLSDAEEEQLITLAKTSVADAAELNQYTSFIGNIMASRISALWDFSGPAITVSSEENSVARCVELADNLFQTSDVEAVIIAAVDLAGSVENIALRSRFGAQSRGNGSIFPNGFVVGEGAGAMVLAPQSKSHNAYATIDACSVANGQTAESFDTVVNKALTEANITAGHVTFVEAYASGFTEENQLENLVVQKYFANAEVDSSKRLFGHSFNASGMLSLITSAVKLNVASDGIAAVNSLGKDGSISQLILKAGKTRPLFESVQSKKPQLIKTVRLGGKNIVETLHAQKSELLSLATKLTPKSKVSDAIDIASVAGKKPAVKTPVVPIATTARKSKVKTTMSTKASKRIDQESQTHAVFIHTRQQAQKQMSDLIALQMDVATGSDIAVRTSSVADAAPHAVVSRSQAIAVPCDNVSVTDTGIQLVERFSKPKQVIYDAADLVEFAEGDIGKVFGPEYNVIDSYSRRVRLPTTDYLLVTRVTDLDAKTHEYKKSYMATEYDIPIDAPYLIDGQIPWSVSVESGQCDLMLISYIGIDFQSKGERVYRLLDCELTFLEEMAFGGETLRYEIHIDSYAKNGDQLLFFFHYDCYVNGKKVLIMRNGCAGFFTDEELADGKGVILTDKDKDEYATAQQSYFEPIIHNTKSQFDYNDMMHLVNGNVAACMGPQYDQQGRNPSLKFSSEKFLMIERVTKIDRTGGHWGLGMLEGQKDLEPHHWYFPCHFKDDQVMAGSLMSEGCGQLAMFYMLWLGMHSGVNNARFQPFFGQPQTVRCRGQVTPQSNTLTYRLEVTEMGMHPYPFVKGNIDIILDGKVVVDFRGLAVMIKEQDDNSPYVANLPDGTQMVDAAKFSQQLNNRMAQEPVETAVENHDYSQQLDSTGKAAFANVNAPLMWVETDHDAPITKGVTPIKHVEAPMPTDPARQNRVPDQLPYTPWHLFEFATGDIGKCFGEKFNVYHGRIPPRTPCGDLQVVTQVIDVQGERFDLKNPSSCVAEYEVPEDAWYFSKNSHYNWMPYSILMEISLQPNGFISGCMGTTLKYPEKDLFFRNLDGSGKLLREVDLRGKTITNKSVMLSTSVAGGSIIQSFTFELLTDGEPFYVGRAVFGYFGGDALANQLGIDNGRTTNPWFVDNNTPESQKDVFDLRNTSLPYFTAPANKPHYKLSGEQMNFVDTVTIVEGGGSESKGYIYGERTIDPTDWFFRYHFHQDPVMPGSLGVEAIIELLQTYAMKNDLGAQFSNPRFKAPLTEVVWKYRGQITPVNKKMELDVHITEVIKTADEVRIVGNANLSKDGLRIYEVKDIVLSVVEA